MKKANIKTMFFFITNYCQELSIRLQSYKNYDTLNTERTKVSWNGNFSQPM